MEEHYLERCINSVLMQEYENFELILVNDGSKDHSGVICDEYAEKDSRVRVIHKANSGVSDSRNQALSQAKGEYIQFLDSDDWLTPEATKSLVTCAQRSGADLVISGFYRVAGETFAPKCTLEREGVLTREEFADEMMENPADFYYGVLWNKLFKRKMIEKYQIRMDPEISWCEDFVFNLEYLRHCRIIYALRAPLYYYVKTKGSLVNSQSINPSRVIRMKLNMFEYYQQFYKAVYDEQSYDNVRFQLYRFLVAGAKDGFVLPAPILGSRKLESDPLLNEYVGAEGDSHLMREYRCRRLREYYYESVADKWELALEDVLVLHCLAQEPGITSTAQIAALTGLTRGKVVYAVQKLEGKELLRRENTQRPVRAKSGQEKSGPKRRRRSFVLQGSARQVLEDIRQAGESVKALLLRGFEDAEVKQLCALEEKLQENAKTALKGLNL